MTIQYAGVDLCLEDPEGELAKHVQRFLEWPRGHINTPPRTIDSKSRVQRPPWPDCPKLRPNQLYVPTGATRWAQFYGIASTEQKDAILEAVDPYFARANLTLSLPDAPTVSISSGNSVDSTFNLQSPININMYMLPPIPVSIDEESVWILPLVDIRYWWQSTVLTLTATTWADLFSQIATELGQTFYRDTTDPIDTAYGVPDPCIWNTGAVNAAAAIDLSCWSTGQRFVRSAVGGGVWALRSSVTAATVYALQRNAQLGTVEGSAAGGDWTGSHASDVPTDISWRFTNDSGTTHHTHGQLSADVPAWAAGEIMSVWSPAVYSISNVSALNAMADKWCEDWWDWSAYRFSWGWNRCLNWHFTGYEDHVLIDFARRGADYNANTFVRSLPLNALTWDFVPTQLEGQENDCTGAAGGGTGGGGGCSCCDCTDCIDLCEALEDDVITDCTACPSGATRAITINVGYWAEYLNLGGPVQLLYTSDCTWESDDLTQDAGVYKWVLNATDKTLALTHVSGSDPTGITTGREVVYKFDGTTDEWSCICQMSLRLQHPDKVKKPSGLKCTVCIQNDQIGTIPACPEIPRDDPDAVVPCFPSITFPSITFLHSDPNPNHWATDTGEPGGTPMTFPYGFEGSTVETVPMGRLLDVSCPWTGGLRTVAAEDPVAGVGGHDGVTYQVDLSYATGEVTFTFHAYQGSVIAKYYLDPALWVIGDNTLDLDTNYSPSDVDWPATVTIAATDCIFGTSHPDVGYGCGGNACGGECRYQVFLSGETLVWAFAAGGATECSDGCGCIGNASEDLNSYLGTPQFEGQTATLNCFPGLT